MFLLTNSVRLAIASLLILLTSVMAHAQDEVVYFHPDGQGSAVAAYNEAGDVCWHQDYTPYGEKIDPLDNFPLAGCGLLGEERGFTGHVQDLSGLVYMQQRYYDPTLMRFMSVDPMSVNPDDERTFNRYSYAANNPYKFVDPDGEAAETAWDVFNVSLGVASLGSNLSDGNYAAAALDTVGIAADSVAAAVPFLPGGFGASIKAARVTNLSLIHI